jgi:hypothetical protein
MMLNRKQLPLVAKLHNIDVDLTELLDHCQLNDLFNTKLYEDIKYSANSKHQKFLVSNEFNKTNFFVEETAPLMEGELYKQLYLTDFDETKASDKVVLKNTTIFERLKRLNPSSPQYLPEADELNYGIRNHLVSGVIENLLNKFKSKVTRVRFAYLHSNFEIKPHVDYDPSYIMRYHIPLITNSEVIMGFLDKDGEHKFNLPADGSVYFFNSGIKHWVKNNSNQGRIHLIIDCHGQEDLVDYEIINEISK